MGWKNWSYWVRGGVIVLSIQILLILISFIGHIMGLFSFFIVISIFAGIGSIILNSLGLGVNSSVTLNIVVNLLVTLIVVFIFGAIIGWIYGKIKNRK